MMMAVYFFFFPVQPRAKRVTDFYYCSGLDEAWRQAAVGDVVIG